MKITLKIKSASIREEDIEIGWEVTIDYDGLHKTNISGKSKVGKEVEFLFEKDDNGEISLKNETGVAI